jgi:hypothetical protein
MRAKFINEDIRDILKPKSKEEIKRDFGNQWPGFKEAREIFEDFTVKAYMVDPGYGYDHVVMCLIEFTKDKRYGLCIYNINNREFISEPGDLEEYSVNYQSFLRRYKSSLTFV